MSKSDTRRAKQAVCLWESIHRQRCSFTKITQMPSVPYRDVLRYKPWPWADAGITLIALYAVGTRQITNPSVALSFSGLGTGWGYVCLKLFPFQGTRAARNHMTQSSCRPGEGLKQASGLGTLGHWCRSCPVLGMTQVWWQLCFSNNDPAHKAQHKMWGRKGLNIWTQ